MATDLSTPSTPGQLERELAYYRRECNDLGARLLRVQEEQSRAFREARRSRTVAKLIREAHRLADTGITPEALGAPVLEIILENALCDRAALLVERPSGSGSFEVTHAVGMTEPRSPPVVITGAPAFFFTTASSRLEPPAYELCGILRLPYILWAYDQGSGHALIIGNRTEQNVNRAFEAGDQELIEGGLSVYLDVLARRQAEVSLRTAMREVEEANNTKATFLATLSHELRTPLNAVIGLSEIMTLPDRPGLTLEKCAEHAEQIRSASRHLLQLINDILDYSSIARGRIALEQEWVRLQAVIQAAVKNAAAQAAARTVTLEAAPIEPSIGVYVDTLRFRQILDNLLGNAVKFTPAEGRVTVSVATHAQGALTITVADTGVGMRPEDIPAALSEFRQIANPLTRSSAGTGLGLTIAKGLVEALGGELRISSQLNEGTRVGVTLPASHVHRQPESPPAR